MSDGFEIGGKRMADNALYPWAVGSLARALLFYAQAQPTADRRALGAIAMYYSTIHLGMFLIYACPKYQTPALKSNIQKRLDRGQDPNRNISHRKLLNYLEASVQHGLPDALLDAVIEAKKLREFINYGPRVYWAGSGDIFVDTCAHDSSEPATLREQLVDLFHDAVGWACAKGEDGGVWIPSAIGAVRGFFEESGRYYGTWCTDKEAA